MGESITQGVLAKWLVKKGDYVEADAVIASIETDKVYHNKSTASYDVPYFLSVANCICVQVTVDVRSPQEGVITEIHSLEGAEVNVGAPLFVLEIDGAKPAAVATGAAPTTEAAPAPAKAVEPKTTPAKAPETKKVDKPAPAAAPTSSSAVATGERTEVRVKMTRMRQRIAQRLKEAQNTAAMLTTFQEVDMTNLMALRNKFKEDFEKAHGVKLGFMSAFVKVWHLFYIHLMTIL